jgi:hypothetical protein
MLLQHSYDDNHAYEPVVCAWCFAVGALNPDKLDEADAAALAATCRRAAEVFATPRYKEMVYNCISQDLSWARPALKWEGLLEELVYGKGAATAKVRSRWPRLKFADLGGGGVLGTARFSTLGLAGCWRTPALRALAASASHASAATSPPRRRTRSRSPLTRRSPATAPPCPTRPTRAPPRPRRPTARPLRA